MNVKFVNYFKNEIKNYTNAQKLIDFKNIFHKKHIIPLYEKLKILPVNEKRDFGKYINTIKNEIQKIYLEKLTEIKQIENNKKNEVNYNVNLNTFNLHKGCKSILTIVEEQIIKYFEKLNFKIVPGTEIVTIKNNMDQLNIDETHPIRDKKDTFYIDDEKMLRTHCTATTAEVIYNQNCETKVLSYGNVYRNDDDDMTHSHQFTQIDIVWIKKNLTINHLKTIIDDFLKYIFGNKIKTRYRLSFFPFTEPSFEVDISCFNCNGKGCQICKNSGWIEILGAGVLHPNVLKKANITAINTGIACGIGIERIVMLKYGLSNIRDIYNNDFKLIEQVKENII